MISQIITFNEVEYITKCIENNDIDSLYLFYNKFDSIIDFIKSVKKSLFDSKDTISVPIPNGKGEMVIERDNMFVGLKSDFVNNVTFNNVNFELSYPKIQSTNFETNIFTSIKKINDIQINPKDIKNLIKNLPTSIYSKLYNYIFTDIIKPLYEVYTFYHVNKKYRKRFVFDHKNITDLTFLLCRYDTEYLCQLRLVLMKEGNYNYSDFDRVTVEDAKKHYKLLKQLYKDESDQ